MNDCVFCNIIAKEIKSEILKETDNLIVIRDILPKAPTHLLVIPKLHIASITETTSEHASLIGELVVTAKEMAEKEGIAGSGYKLIFNVGKDGGQVVQHIHLHLLGGKPLGE